MRILLRIALKELREVSRDRAAWGVLTIYTILLSTCCISFSIDWAQNFSHQLSLQREAREAWLAQGTMSPHQATHTGTIIYKLPSPLGSYDPGVSSVVGSRVKLESHKRHETTNAIDEDRLSIIQLEFTSPALLMQVISPLVVIVLSHAVVAKERELGTSDLLASVGVSRVQVVNGKLVSLFVLTVAISLPVLVCLLWSVACCPTDAGMTLSSVFARASAVYVANLAYLAIWCAAGTACSARLSPGASLTILLSVWAGWTLVIPRVAVDLAYSRFPLPGQQSLSEARETAIQKGDDGQLTLEEFNVALEERLMKEYGVAELEDVPVDLNAARLLSMEDFTNAIDDNAQRRLEEIYRKQNRFLDWFQLASPYLAMRSLSSSFAGTDRHHHDAFVNSAESYRRMLVKTMNTAEMKGERPGPSDESSRSFWNQVSEYRQSYPPLIDVCDAMRWQIGLLSLWLFVSFFVALVPTKRMSA